MQLRARLLARGEGPCLTITAELSGFIDVISRTGQLTRVDTLSRLR